MTVWHLETGTSTETARDAQNAKYQRAHVTIDADRIFARQPMKANSEPSHAVASSASTLLRFSPLLFNFVTLICPLLSNAQEAASERMLQDCATCPPMVVVPGGSFIMGSPDTELERRDVEGPQIELRIEQFAMSATEVTRGQYARFAADTERSEDGGCFTYGFGSFTDPNAIDPRASWRNPGFEQSEDHPVVCVSWTDAKEYAAWLTLKTGERYRLPSEAEWEYAARAGVLSRFSWGEDEAHACRNINGAERSLLRALPQAYEQAISVPRQQGEKGVRYFDCDDGAAFTAPARRYPPNGFGLYEMTGNVWEWVDDCWSASLPRTQGSNFDADCKWQRTRGGSWDDYPQELRFARRARLEPRVKRNDVGIRVVRDLMPARGQSTARFGVKPRL